jgi:hypothetical protein
MRAEVGVGRVLLKKVIEGVSLIRDTLSASDAVTVIVACFY